METNKFYRPAFTQVRTGEFICFIKPGTPHCGLDNEPAKIFSYRVVCCSDDEVLDEQGFIMDNFAISAYFRKYCNPANPIDISCECLAKQMAKELALLMPRKGFCDEVAVTIYPFDGAEITYHWYNPSRKKGT